MVPASHDGNTTWVELGVEPELIARVGHVRALGDPGGWDVGIGGSAKVAPLRLVQGAWRIDAVGRLERGGDRWAVRLMPSLFVAHSTSRVGGLTGIGLEVRGGPRWGSGRASGGLDLGWQTTLATHVAPSEITRDSFADRGADPLAPEAGWLAGPVQRFRVGVDGAVPAGDAVDVTGAVGALATLNARGALFSFDLGQLPFYAELGLVVGW